MFKIIDAQLRPIADDIPSQQAEVFSRVFELLTAEGKLKFAYLLVTLIDREEPDDNFTLTVATAFFYLLQNFSEGIADEEKIRLKQAIMESVPAFDTLDYIAFLARVQSDRIRPVQVYP